MTQATGYKAVDAAAVTSSTFMFMPFSAQVLYFNLMVRSDGDGFIKDPSDICRALGCGGSDLELLEKSGYITRSNVSTGIFVNGAAHIELNIPNISRL